MGVDVVVGGARQHELEAVERLFAEWEATFSRFLPGSELSRVNACASRSVVVSPLFARALRTAIWAARITEGIVDPTLGAALVEAGYDRDFADLDDAKATRSAPSRRWSWRSLRIGGSVLTRPPGLILDLNGVVKGLVVDEASRLVTRGFVSAGGDIAVATPTDVGLPDGSSVRMTGGGLATSGTTKRRWTRGGTLRHHLIDPWTGAPSESRWDQVTVAAASCLAADVAAKAAFLLSEDGPGWLDERGLPGRFITDGRVLANAAWRRALATDRPAVAA